jgi:hypothetical protein
MPRVRPAVFVVADQRAVGVGRQRGLAGARQAEEHRGVALRADVGRAVHRHHALRGQQVVEQIVNTLFFISPAYSVPPIRTVFSVEIDRDHRPLRQPWRAGSALKLGQVDNGVFGQ